MIYIYRIGEGQAADQMSGTFIYIYIHIYIYIFIWGKRKSQT